MLSQSKFDFAKVIILSLRVSAFKSFRFKGLIFWFLVTGYWFLVAGFWSMFQVSVH